MEHVGEGYVLRSILFIWNMSFGNFSDLSCAKKSQILCGRACFVNVWCRICQYMKFGLNELELSIVAIVYTVLKFYNMI